MEHSNQASWAASKKQLTNFQERYSREQPGLLSKLETAQGRQPLLKQQSQEKMSVLQRAHETLNDIEARAGLKIIQSILRINNLKGFGDFEDIELQSVAGTKRCLVLERQSKA